MQHHAEQAPELPFDVIDAAVTAIGKAFWYKGPLRTLLIRCGVPAPLYDRFSTEAKYVIARNVFDELLQKGENGRIVALRIVEELCAIRKIPADVPDPSGAAKALETLRLLSKDIRKVRSDADLQRERAAADARQQREKHTLRNERLTECKQRFYTLLNDGDPQTRGFALEALLKDLFDIHEIEYQPSFRAEVQQTDGAFRFDSFHYLVEIKWTRDETSLAALDAFKSKVERKLASTRGLFLSMAGFSDDVIREFQHGTTRSILLMTGEDLILILEDRVSLTDALELKTRLASQNGDVYVPLKTHI